MSSDKNPMIWSELPRIGSEFVKLKTGELVRWKSFDDKKTQMLEVEMPDGKTAKVHRRGVDIPTPNEELDYLRSLMRPESRS